MPSHPSYVLKLCSPCVRKTSSQDWYFESAVVIQSLVKHIGTKSQMAVSEQKPKMHWIVPPCLTLAVLSLSEATGSVTVVRSLGTSQQHVAKQVCRAVCE